MQSVNSSDHIAKEKRSTSRLNNRSKSNGKETRRFTIAIATTLVASSLLMELAPVPTTHAATNMSPSTSNTSVQSTSSSSVEKKLYYTAVQGAYYYTIALRNDGSVWAWGRNLWGELGVSDTVRYRHTFSPIRIPKISNVTVISSSGGGNNAAIQADGTIWEWGNGNMPRQVPDITSAKNVRIGAFSTIALLQDGTVLSWQNPPQAVALEQTRKLQTISGLKDIIQVESTGLHGYALKKDGSVWTWNEPNEPGKAPSKPTKLKGLNNISSITGADASLLALDKKGKAWQLDLEGIVTPFHHELKVKKMDGNSGYTLLLTTSGEVYSYGRTVTGKEGRVNHLSGITDVSAGYHHSLALSSEGTVWGWGSDKYQEAGAPATSSGGMVYKPVQAKLGIDVYLNGELFQSMYPAVETSKTIQLPIKAIAAAIGAEFEVHKVENSLSYYTLKYNNRTITITPNEAHYHITSTDSSSEQLIELSEPINNYSGATTLPFEVLRGLGLNVSWDSEKSLLTIDDLDKKKSGL
ncbi:stalk domain-containing protein [Paenibacillus sp. ClWae2A]|uniref:RCC1 domain-containing protein n=1 Tax=Paenibacillus sp. ClWae2A TaxID=3057177 RepID=UPI0028F569B1|nr:stalk domain-containing protein [Paenibacillus sp. ClWae2A]MDT9721036.1 stalk domain-containing protein [Paenibacillus sp. ClWae2A]